MRNDAYVTLAAMEHDWGYAWIAKDAELCAEMIGDDYVEIASNGRFLSKTEWIAAMPGSAPRQMQWLELRVRPMGRCAVVHGRLRLLGSGNGHEHRDTFVATDIWVWRADRWQIVSRQLTSAHTQAAVSEGVLWNAATRLPAGLGEVH